MKSRHPTFRRLALGLLTLAAAAGALAFTFVFNDNTGLPVKWPAGTIRIKIMLGESKTLIDGSTFNTSARTAAQTWNAFIGSAQFQTELATGTASSNNKTNELSFSNKIFGKDFDSGTLAITTGFSSGNERTETDIIFNTAYNWDSYRGNTRTVAGALLVDLQRVALHELGHVLGLDHPDQADPVQSVNAVMNSRIGNLYDLTGDDTTGAQSLYGPPGIPTNDAFANSAVITLPVENSISLKGFNTNATRETGEPTQGDNPGGRSVWWRWTAPSNGIVGLDTKGSYYDTTLGVYTGNSVSSLTKITDNDDINPGVVQASTVTFNTSTGTTYRFAVDGYNAIEQDASDLNGADSGGYSLNLSFTPVGGTLPSITTQPLGATVNAGSSVSFTVTATGTDPLSYQWQLNGTAIAGATSATYNIASASAAQAGNYTVLVSNPAGSVTSNTATLTVNTPTPPPTPAPSGGGGGGGGAASTWFLLALAAIALGRRLSRS